jgi:hypothetical protein
VSRVLNLSKCTCRRHLCIFPQLLLRQRIVTLEALPSTVLEVHLQTSHHKNLLSYCSIAESLALVLGLQSLLCGRLLEHGWVLSAV